jgi:hypothetical protein
MNTQAIAAKANVFASVERGIRATLGLLDAQEFRLERLLELPEKIETHGRDWVKANTERGTGRTTNIIIEALAHAFLNPSQSIGFSSSRIGQADRMKRIARDYGLKLGLDPGMFHAGGSALMFADHD